MVVIGVVIVLIALVDALWTTLWLEGAGGPLTSRVTTGLWRTTLAFSGTERHRLLSLAGPFILCITVFVWVVLGEPVRFFVSYARHVQVHIEEESSSGEGDRCYFDPPAFEFLAGQLASGSLRFVGLLVLSHLFHQRIVGLPCGKSFVLLRPIGSPDSLLRLVGQEVHICYALTVPPAFYRCLRRPPEPPAVRST